MTGIQRVMNKCLHFLQLEERAKADGDPERAKRARVMYRANKLKLNAMRVKREALADLYEQHQEIHKLVTFSQYSELVELSLEGVNLDESDTKNQDRSYSASEQIV